MYTFRKFEEGDSKIWNEINNSSPYSTFLTDKNWIEFTQEFGRNIEKFVIEDSKEIVGIFSIEIWKRKLSKYAYLPRGPVMKNLLPTSHFLTLLKSLKNFGQNYCAEKNLNLFRIDPLFDTSEAVTLKNAGWSQSMALGQVKNTWIMSLRKGNSELARQRTGLPLAENKKEMISEDELFNLQKKDTRYYIRRAEKKGVKIIKASTVEQVEEFNKLMVETKERNEFWGFTPEYYSKQWRMLNMNGDLKSEDLKKSICEIFLAEFEGKYISGALINYSHDTAHYAHGASTSDKEASNLASPYLLLWKTIIDAKEEGYEKFDFWGVIPKGVKHEWRGLSDFKMKFEGEFVQYTGTYEVYANPLKYIINRAFDWWSYRDLRY